MQSVKPMDIDNLVHAKADQIESSRFLLAALEEAECEEVESRSTSQADVLICHDQTLFKLLV